MVENSKRAAGPGSYSEFGGLVAGELDGEAVPGGSWPGRTDSDALGLVVGTVPATPLGFSVGLAPGQYAQLDDVVTTRRELPGHAGVQISGVVTNVEATHEGARFASDVFLIQQGALPAEVCEVAEVAVTRVEPEVYVPPMPGAPVLRATGAQRDSALYFDEMGASKVPVGFGRDGQPVFVNFEFVDGTRGAHVSISGVSGIATKTSFAMFLLHSITNCGVLAGEAHAAAEEWALVEAAAHSAGNLVGQDAKDSLR
jgi:hypothetical protein